MNDNALGTCWLLTTTLWPEPSVVFVQKWVGVGKGQAGDRQVTAAAGKGWGQADDGGSRQGAGR